MIDYLVPIPASVYRAIIYDKLTIQEVIRILSDIAAIGENNIPSHNLPALVELDNEYSTK